MKQRVTVTMADVDDAMKYNMKIYENTNVGDQFILHSLVNI